MWVVSRFRFSWFLKLFGSLMKSIVIALWHNCDPEPDLASDVHSLVMHDWTWQHYYKKGNFRVTLCLCFKKSLPVHIFKWIVLHVDSFWHWGIRHLSNGLLAQHNVNNNICWFKTSPFIHPLTHFFRFGELCAWWWTLDFTSREIREPGP